MSATVTPKSPPASIDLPALEHSLRKPRTLLSAGLSIVTGGLAVVAAFPLFSVLFMLVYKGGGKLVSAGLGLFTEVAPAAGMSGGGIGNALVGTLLVVGIATLLSVPAGVLAGVYLAEINPEGRLSSAVRFCAKVLTGLPSVLAGLVAYATVVLTTRQFSAPAGGLALAILMLPTIILTAENAIKMVPRRMREAAVGLGCTPTQVVLKVVLPTATPGILTGIMLAVARAAGETAPLLFTALFSAYWLSPDPRDLFAEPVATLAVLIYDFSAMPFANQIEIAWTASLVLVLMVLATNIAAQLFSARRNTR